MEIRPLTLDVLIRTSKRKKDAKSPQQQRDIARACAETNGYELGLIHDSGRDESGKTMARASVEAAMARLHAGDIDGVMVAFLDRFGRAPIEEAMAVVREIHAASGVLVPADAGGQPIRPDDPQGETNLVLQLQMARQFWLQTAKRFKGSQADAIARGAFIGPGPFGYVKGPGGTLVVDPQWGPVVSEAFRVAAADGLHGAMAYLKAAAPHRRWRTDEARSLLCRRTYLGEVHHGDHEPNLEAHEPLTTPGLFEAAQTEPRRRRTNGEYPLSGIASCGKCGGALVGALQSVHGYRYRRMRCSNPECRGGSSISADRLEEYVRDALRPMLADDDFRLRFDPDGAEDAGRALADAEAERSRFARDTEAHDLLGETDWRAGLRSRAAAVADARERVGAIAAASARSEQLPGPDELDEPHQFVRALAVIGTLTVRPGRGTLDDRVRLGWATDDVDDGVGMLAA